MNQLASLFICAYFQNSVHVYFHSLSLFLNEFELSLSLLPSDLLVGFIAEKRIDYICRDADNAEILQNKSQNAGEIGGSNARQNAQVEGQMAGPLVRNLIYKKDDQAHWRFQDFFVGVDDGVDEMNS